MMDCSFNNNLSPVALNQNRMEIEPDSIGPLPTELVSKIFSSLPSELARWALVSRSWKEWAYAKSFEIREKEDICDEKQWKKYIGDPGIQPHLPLTLLKDYDKNTHLLTFIPVTIDEQPLTMLNIEPLVSHPKNGGHATKYRFVSDEIRTIYGDTPNPKVHWLLLKKDLFEETIGKAYDVQKGIVKDQGMEVSELLGTIVSVFMRFVSKGERVYKAGERNKLWTFTRVKEKIGKLQIVVGGFSAAGLIVNNHYGTGNVGAAGARKSMGH
jgi:F-box associated protein